MKLHHHAWISVLTASLLVACTMCVTCGPANDGPQELGDPTLEHVRKMVAFGPRPTGSAALRQCGDYIIEELKKTGATVETDEWEERGMKLRNILGKLEGDPKRIVILASHYDTKKFEGHADPAHNFRFVGANDAGSSSGMLLTLARVLKDRKDRKSTVWFAFFDGEECLHPTTWNDDDALFGSRRMANRLFTDWQEQARAVRALVLFDLVGGRNVSLDTLNETNSSPGLVEIFEKAAARVGHDKVFAARREGESGPITDDHVPFKKRGVAIVDLIDLRSRQPAAGEKGDLVRHWHTEFDTMEALSSRSLQMVAEVTLAAWPELEKL